MKRLLFITTVVAIVLSSCASFMHMQDVNSVSDFSTFINKGRIDTLIKMSRVPFLLDQEIIVLPKDIRTFWTNIVHAGFKITKPELEQGETVNENSYLEFYNSMEVKTFFKKYVAKDARIIRLKTGTGKSILLIIELKLLGRYIRGFKGPY